MSEFNHRSGMTRLKQRTKEWFNKQNKTVDPNFEMQNKQVLEQMA